MKTTGSPITVDSEIHGGDPVFTGTDVPVKTLIESIADGVTLDQFLESFPAVSRRQALEALETLIRRSLSVSSRRQDLLDKVYALFEECRQANWDGYNARPVQSATFLMAQKFAELWPLDLPLPEVSADPDGEITFEWFVDSKRLFNASLGSAGILSYAGLHGENRAHGTEMFGDAIPPVVLAHVDELCRDGRAS